MISKLFPVSLLEGNQVRNLSAASGTAPAPEIHKDDLSAANRKSKFAVRPDPAHGKRLQRFWIIKKVPGSLVYRRADSTAQRFCGYNGSSRKTTAISRSALVKICLRIVTRIYLLSSHVNSNRVLCLMKVVVHPQQQARSGREK